MLYTQIEEKKKKDRSTGFTDENFVYQNEDVAKAADLLYSVINDSWACSKNALTYAGSE